MKNVVALTQSMLRLLVGYAIHKKNAVSRLHVFKASVTLA